MRTTDIDSADASAPASADTDSSDGAPSDTAPSDAASSDTSAPDTSAPDTSAPDTASPERVSAEAGGLVVQQVGMDRLETIRALNVAIFDEERIINTFDRDGVLLFLAAVDGEPAGFKLGYQINSDKFYSAKGGVLPDYRRRGIARALLHEMLAVVRAEGYTRFAYDTFPNKHPGMTVMGLEEGFEVVKAGYSPQYEDYRLRFELEL